MLLRVALRIDTRMVIAAIGTAAAMVLPVAAGLAAGSLDIRAGGDYLLYPDGVALDPPPGAHLASVVGLMDGVKVAAYVVGDPIVAPDEALRMPLAQGEFQNVSSTATKPHSIIPVDAILVHPDRIIDGQMHAALRSIPSAVPGWTAIPARGADAFEVAGAEAVSAATGILLWISIPAVAVVAALFADHEARQLQRTAATLAALGRPGLGARLLAARSAWMVLLGAAGAAGLASGIAVLGLFGNTGTLQGVARNLLIPAVAAIVVAWSMAAFRLRGATRLLSAQAQDAQVALRIPMPLPLRPIVTGFGALPILLVAAALFTLDVGLPLAASSIPASLAAGTDEWVVGSEEGLLVGGSTRIAPEAVLWRHPEIDQIVAETVATTVIRGEPVVVRGADWQRWRDYHGVAMASGAPPSDDEIALGAGLATRLGVKPGATIMVPGADIAGMHELRVSGIFHAPGLLTDEALVTMPRGQAMVNLPASEATLLRVRPATFEARAALAIRGPQIEVVDVQATAGDAGTPMDIDVRLVNLGAGPGVRPLTIRINGEAEAAMNAALGPHEDKIVQIPILAPQGTFTVEVNPTIQATAGAPKIVFGAPSIAFPGDTVIVQVAGPVEEFSLHRSLTSSRNGSDPIEVVPLEGGRGSFVVNETGELFMAAQGAMQTILVGQPENRNKAQVEVVHAWTEPAEPRQGAPMTLHVAYRNVGGVAGSVVADVFQDGGRIQYLEAFLEAGEVQHDAYRFFVRVPARNVSVGNYVYQVGDISLPEPVVAPEVRSGGQVQARVADRVLGDATAVLGGLALTALLATIPVVYLGTDRTLRSRGPILATLTIMTNIAWVRRRAVMEAAVMGAGVALLVVATAKVLLSMFGARLIIFGHALPDPFGFLATLQIVIGFGATSALAAYASSGRAIATSMPISSVRGVHDPLPERSVRTILEAE